jgi:hypothetical protein
MTAKSPDDHIACCLALIDGVPGDVFAEPPDTVVVIT